MSIETISVKRNERSGEKKKKQRVKYKGWLKLVHAIMRGNTASSWRIGQNERKKKLTKSEERRTKSVGSGGRKW